MLKKIGIAAAIVLVVAIGMGAYFWHEATALPDWYAEADPATLKRYAAEDTPDAAVPQWIPLTEDGEAIEPEPAPEAIGVPAPPSSETPSAERKPRKRKRRGAARHELRGFHRRGKKGSGRSAVKASRAIYEDGRLEAGVVFDLSRIPKDKLVDRDRELYDRAVDQFPGITKRDVYIGIEDRPVTSDGVLQLGPSPKVRVGNLRYSLDKAARKIGMTPAQLRREFDRELRRLGFVDPAARN